MRLKSMIVNVAAVMATLCTGMASAEYLDHRTDPNLPNVVVALKGATVEDAVSILVPNSWVVTYQSQSVRNVRITSAGEGSWPELLDQGLRSAGLGMSINKETRSITILQGPPAMTAGVANPAVAVAPATTGVRTITAPAGTPPVVRAETSGVSQATILAVQQAARAAQAQAAASQAVVTPAAATAAQPVLLKPVAAAPARMYKVRATDGSYSRVIQRWADESNMQLVWEEADVDYPVKGESEFSSDIAASLTDLLISTHGSRTPLRACIHPNKPYALIRIIRKADLCDPQASL